MTFYLAIEFPSLICNSTDPLLSFKAELGFVIQVSWKNVRLPYLSLALYSDHYGHVLANHRSFQRAHIPIGCSMLCLSKTGDVAMSWLAVETSDVPYILKLASGDLTSWISGDSVRRLKSNWDGPIYCAAAFPSLVWADDNKQNKTPAGAKNRQETGAAELRPQESHATASLISRCCQPQL